MLKFLLDLMPFQGYRELEIDYAGIQARASLVKPVDSKNPIVKVEDLKLVNIKMRPFVVSGFEWCDENLGKTNGNYRLKINYTFSQTIGTYIYDDKLFVIRVWNYQKLILLVETIVHEYIHYLQFKTKRVKALSNKLHYKLGYLNNPYEIEARVIADKLKNLCLNSLLAKINS